MSYSNEVILNRIHCAILYCAVRAWEKEVRDLQEHGLDRQDAELAVGSPGIARIWGNRRRLHINGSEATWKFIGRDGEMKERLIPAGEVNRFIIARNMGNPIFDATTFYRLVDKLEQAGWTAGGDHKFAVLAPGRRFNEQVLIPGADDPMVNWPYYIPVQNGQVQRHRVKGLAGSLEASYN